MGGMYLNDTDQWYKSSNYNTTDPKSIEALEEIELSSVLDMRLQPSFPSISGKGDGNWLSE